jgi:hypothetical protein
VNLESKEPPRHRESGRASSDGDQPLLPLHHATAAAPTLSAQHRVKLRSSIMLGFVSFNSLILIQAPSPRGACRAESTPAGLQ